MITIRIITGLFQFYQLTQNLLKGMLCHPTWNHDLLYNKQSAYSTNRSCETALLNLTDNWLKALDNSNLVGSVFLDLSKAFNLVSHDILLSLPTSSERVIQVQNMWPNSNLRHFLSIILATDIGTRRSTGVNPGSHPIFTLNQRPTRAPTKFWRRNIRRWHNVMDYSLHPLYPKNLQNSPYNASRWFEIN